MPATFCVAPLQRLDRLERVAFERLREFRLEWRTSSRRTKGSITRGTARAPGDLRQFGRIELAELIAIEFPVGSKGDMIDIEIESHTDRIGGDEIFDIAGLIELDLSVSCARGQRAEHDCRAASLAADQLGDGIDLFGRKRDDRGTTR